MTIVRNAINVARKGVSVLKSNSRGLMVAGSVLATAGSAHAAIDLAPVTTGVTDSSTAMVGIAASIIGAGIAVGAIKWGARFGIGLFKIFGK